MVPAFLIWFCMDTLKCSVGVVQSQTCSELTGGIKQEQNWEGGIRIQLNQRLHKPELFLKRVLLSVQVSSDKLTLHSNPEAFVSFVIVLVVVFGAE